MTYSELFDKVAAGIVFGVAGVYLAAGLCAGDTAEDVLPFAAMMALAFYGILW